MDHVDEYLLLPAEYVQALGGLAWSADGETIERRDGSSFAFAGEIASFAEGFALHRPLIHFGHMLHLLYLLRSATGPAHLRQAFREAGQIHRNAGAFCGVLCRGLPPAP